MQSAPTVLSGVAQFCFDSRVRGPYHARAMADPLRDRRPLRELAANRQAVEISGKISDFQRLLAVIEKDIAQLPADVVARDWRDAPVTGRLAFATDDALDGAAVLDLALAVTLPAQCQRCLRAFEMPLETQLGIALAAPGQTLDAHSEREVWEWPDERPRLLDIAEEALIMALPLAAKHESSDDCIDIDTPAEMERTTTPFASLRAQMDEHK